MPLCAAKAHFLYELSLICFNLTFVCLLIVNINYILAFNNQFVINCHHVSLNNSIN